MLLEIVEENNKPVFVEGISKSLTLILPFLVGLDENEGLTKQILHKNSKGTSFVNCLVFSQHHFLNNLWVCYGDIKLIHGKTHVKELVRVLANVK